MRKATKWKYKVYN